MIHIKWLVPPSQVISESPIPVLLDRAFMGQEIEMELTYDTRVPVVWAVITDDGA